MFEEYWLGVISHERELPEWRPKGENESIDKLFCSDLLKVDDFSANFRQIISGNLVYGTYNSFDRIVFFVLKADFVKNKPRLRPQSIPKHSVETFTGNCNGSDSTDFLNKAIKFFADVKQNM